jgi:membrane protein implicated in regulation of membrane protease activity
MNEWLAFWLLLAVALSVAEALTVNLVSVWVALGCVAGMACAALGLPVWAQWLVVTAVSAALVVATRPLAKRVAASRVRTNADRAVGQTGKVAQTIDNLAGQGQVSVGGQLWTARSADGETLAEGALVEVLEIQGVKLIVRPTK